MLLNHSDIVGTKIELEVGTDFPRDVEGMAVDGEVEEVGAWIPKIVRSVGRSQPAFVKLREITVGLKGATIFRTS